MDVYSKLALHVCCGSGCHGVTVLNSPGTIDRDYRGEIKVILINHGTRAYYVEPGDRIAQMVFGLAHPDVTFIKVESVDDDTERGSGGIGSTGV